MLNQVVYKEKVSKQAKENTQNWGKRLQFLFSKSWMYWKTFTYPCFKQHWWHEICQLFVKVSYCSRRLGKCRNCWSLKTMQYCGFITMRMSILLTIWLIVLSKFFAYKSYTSMSSNISFFTFLYLSCSGKLLAVEVCTRPYKDALLVF